MWDFDCVDWMAKGEGVIASRQGAHMRFEDFWAILGLRGIIFYSGSSFRPLLHPTLGYRVISTFPRRSCIKYVFVNPVSHIGGSLLQAGWRGHRGGSMAQIASTQEQAAQLIASMVGLAWGSLLNICRVVLLHCAALHSIQFPRFCMWWPLSLHSLVFWSFQTITAFLFESDDFRNEFGSIPVQWLHPSSLLVSRNTMPDIAKSDISPNLDRDKMFNELWWLNYCFCEGVGIGAVGNPFFGGEAVNICLHSKCEMTDIGDPFCSNIRVCLCLTDQCSLPPAPGSPICVCFNKKLAGDDGWSGQQLFDWSTSFGDTFWLYYIFCFGIGFSAPQANGRPLFAVQTKELCIKAGTKLATPMEGGKLCSSVSTRLCFWDQCAMPPAEGAPMFSCFNLLNSKGASAKPLAYGSWDILSQVSTSNADVLLWYCEQPCSTKVFEHGVFLSFADLLASCQGNGVSDEASLHRFLFVTGTLPNLAGWKKKVLAI